MTAGNDGSGAPASRAGHSSAARLSTDVVVGQPSSLRAPLDDLYAHGAWADTIQERDRLRCVAGRRRLR